MRAVPKVMRPVTVRMRSSAQASRALSIPGKVSHAGHDVPFELSVAEAVAEALERAFAFLVRLRDGAGASAAAESERRTFFAIDLRS
jgi:hypothetical protein